MIGFRLYILNRNHDSIRDIERLLQFLNDRFSNKYSLEIIDVLENPEEAAINFILATPTLVKITPKPIRKIIGDFSDIEKVLAGLGLHNR